MDRGAGVCGHVLRHADNRPVTSFRLAAAFTELASGDLRR
jgi:hypothetical protein